jgi:copper(I)-binding protein
MAADKLPQKAKIVGGTITGATLSGCTINADDLTAPSVVSGVSATAKPLHVRLKWTNPTELDFSHVEIYRHTADVSGSASVIARTKADIYRDHDGTLATTYWYWAKTVDVAGNKSAFVALGNAAPATVAVATETNAGTMAQQNASAASATFESITFNAAGSAATIASGVLTTSYTTAIVSGEGGAADDLVTISSPTAGRLLILQMAGAGTITVKNGTGNIILAGSDFVMDNTRDRLVLIGNAGLNWVELCRSNNG